MQLTFIQTKCSSTNKSLTCKTVGDANKRVPLLMLNTKETELFQKKTMDVS